MLTYDKNLIKKASLCDDVMVVQARIGIEIYDASPRIPKLLGITQDSSVPKAIRRKAMNRLQRLSKTQSTPG